MNRLLQITARSIGRGGVAALRIGNDVAGEIQLTALTVLAIFVAAVLLQWGINIFWAPGANYIFFFGGMAAIVAFATAPVLVGGAAIAGSAIAFLKDEDLSLGAYKGITSYIKFVLGVMFGFVIISGLLSTFPFKHSPGSFFAIAAMIIVISLVVALYFKGGGKKLAYIVMVYVVAVIAVEVYRTIPQEEIDKVFASAPAATTNRTTPEGIVLNQWQVYKVPAIGNLPKVVPFGKRYVCTANGDGTLYNVEFRNFGTPKAEMLLTSTTPMEVEAHILVSNSKTEARRINSTCR